MRTITRRSFACSAALLPALRFTSAHALTSVSPADARTLAKEAYIYGFPMVDNYRIQYVYFVDHASPEYKAPWNQLRNIPRVYTPDDKTTETQVHELVEASGDAKLGSNKSGAAKPR
jgi:hypothetical protein